MATTGALALAVTLLYAFPPSAATDAGPASTDRRIDQAAEYKAEVPKTIVELQQFRRSESIPADGVGGRRGTATLVDVNPTMGAWFLLSLDWGKEAGSATYHLENPNPGRQTIRLVAANPHGVQISSDGRTMLCDLWSGGAVSLLEQAKRSALPYAPLCDGRLYLRNRVKGSATSLERTTDFLRSHVWGGEQIIGFVRKTFYQDSFIEKATPGVAAAPMTNGIAPADWPRPAALNADEGDQPVIPEHLGIDLGQAGRALMPGRWYPVNGLAGVYVSAVQPRMIAPEILNSYRNVVNKFDPVEAEALDYLVAFDLSDFDLGFAVGTDHPRVGWSDRILDRMRNNNLPGPDGIDTVAPLVTNGMISPALAPRTVATFTGGFKREHGAFRYGPFAERNHGSHYGFIEQGAVLSKPVPGLSTLYVLDDGSVDMKTWTEQDDALLSRVKFARQNGVPLIDYDPKTDVSAPGSLVARWGPGNWSGSAKEELRTLRAGACLQQTPRKRFLIYGYFSAATPSAMARVFQAYGCRYAMHLDMNALEHTYLALYLRQGSEIVVQHLIEGMAQLDKTTRAGMAPRFLGVADDRDFFYLVRRE